MPTLVDIRLTETMVRSAKPKTERYDINDANVRGFGMRVSPTGTKSWFAMRRVNGTMKRKTLGRYPSMPLTEARTEAQRVLAQMAKGELEDPSKDMTLEVAVDEWLIRDQSSNRTVGQVRLAISNDVLPALRARRLNDIKKRDVNRIIDGIVERGAGVQANRTLSFLRRFFNWCAERDYLDKNPTRGIPKPFAEKGRDRVLTMDELIGVMIASDKLGYPFGPFLKLLVLTGQRRDEVAEAKWDEFDITEGRWTIPSERAKNGKAHVVHLSDEAIAILGALPRIEGHKHLFSTRSDRPVSGFSKAKKRIDEISGVTGWTLHDLRRSFATHTTESLGMQPVVIDKILNHQSGAVRGVAAVYQRGQYLNERREALVAWSDHLTAAVSKAGSCDENETND